MNAQRVDRGHTWTFSDQEQFGFDLRFEIPASEGKYSHRAVFLVGDSEETVVSCSIEVYEDVTIRPSALLQAFPAGERRSVNKSLSIWQTARGKDNLARSVHIERLPGCVYVVSMAPVGGPEEVEPGIDRQEFKLVLRVSPVDELQSTPMATPIIVSLDAPREIHFGLVKSSEVQARRILLRSADEREFRVLGISTSHEGTKGKASSGSATRHWLEVTFQPMNASDSGGCLKIETDHPDCPRVRIDLRYTVRESI
ncbi:MAG: hypothetical protein HQ582_10835 [Planctomycetes bacterium]|nr:hypothetical protein [Planctomycetota bacterium]